MGTSFEELIVEGIAMLRYQIVELGVREAKDRYSGMLRQVSEGAPDGRETIAVIHRHGRPYAAVVRPDLLKRLVSVLAASGSVEGAVGPDGSDFKTQVTPVEPKEAPSPAGGTSCSAPPDSQASIPVGHHQEETATALLRGTTAG